MTSNAQVIDALSMRNPQAVLRLTALWAVVESGLGGILHAFRLPLTGLIIGGTAVILITLLAHFAERPREILRATVIVLIIKALVSPHSPIGAYLAVGFQGLLGWLVYSFARPGYLSTIPFALVALIESAIQKLLMLVLFFGKPLWIAVDSWGGWVIERYFPSYVNEGLSLSWTLVASYVAIYVIGGIIVGYLAVKTAQNIASQLVEQSKRNRPALRATFNEKQPSNLAKKGNRKRRKFFWWIGIALVLGASIYFSNAATTALRSAILYLVRTLSIVVIWYFIIGPWLAKIFRRWLLGKSSRYANEIEEVMEILPALKQVAKQEYSSLSAHYTGITLYRTWLMRILAICLTLQLSPKPEPNSIIDAE